MFAEIEGSTVFFSGRMDERDTDGELAEILAKALANAAPGRRIKVDFYNVEAGNSQGLRAWLNAVNAAQPVLCYCRVPQWFVEQFGWVTRLTESEVEIESIFLNFYSRERDEVISRLIVIGKDLSLNEELSSSTLSFRENGVFYEPELDPVADLAFLFTLKQKKAR